MTTRNSLSVRRHLFKVNLAAFDSLSVVGLAMVRMPLNHGVIAKYDTCKQREKTLVNITTKIKNPNYT